MKTASAYIAELDANAKGYDGNLVLFVGFENTTLPIAFNADDRLQLLTDMMEFGGIPFGFAGIGDGRVDFGLLPKYEGDEHLMGVLTEIGSKTVSLIDAARRSRE
jgi:hypothetical protein